MEVPIVIAVLILSPIVLIGILVKLYKTIPVVDWSKLSEGDEDTALEDFDRLPPK